MWSRQEAISNAPPMQTWPDVAIEAIDECRADRYRSMVEAVLRYFNNETISSIRAITGVDGSTLVRQAKKCLQLADDGNVLGFRALIPNLRTKSYSRKAGEKRKFPEAVGGHAAIHRT
jgi:hypothetical protein